MYYFAHFFKICIEIRTYTYAYYVRIRKVHVRIVYQLYIFLRPSKLFHGKKLQSQSAMIFQHFFGFFSGCFFSKIRHVLQSIEVHKIEIDGIPMVQEGK